MEEIYFLKKLGVRIEEDMHTCISTRFMNTKFHLYQKNINDILSDIETNRDFHLEINGNNLWLCMVIRKDLFLNLMTENIINRSSRIRLLSNTFNNIKNGNSNCLNFENYNDNDDDSQNASYKFNVNKFYELLREEYENVIYSDESSDDNIDFDSILSIELRPYQKKAVRWLINRETQLNKILKYNWIQLEYEAKAYEINENKNKLYLNKKTLHITNEWPFYNVLPRGGILADEMGLGKTIEILSLILLNRNLKISNETEINHRNIDSNKEEVISKTFEPPSKKCKYDNTQLYCICSKSEIKIDLIQCSICLKSQHRKCVTKFVGNENDYKCPECWSSCNDLIKSSATVIVSPRTIALQWLNEIEKHSKIKLNTFYYKGYVKCGWINPKDLSEFDIIVTDYNILKREIYYCNASRNLRSPKKYMRIKSPLLLVKWQRVCLDEAQMVENVTSLAAQMVKLLPAKYRWAITGTPIQKSVDDLKGLLDFIGAYPFFENRVWNDLVNFQKLHNDTMPLVRVMGNLMWRTCKVNVLDEIGVPSQSEIIHYITMSDAEILYYRSEHQSCSTAFEDKIEKYAGSSTSLSHLDLKTVKKILQPLLKLRQICSVPITIQKTQQNTLGKNYLQPDKLLDHLKTKYTNDCKKELRRICSSYNGMAAIDIIVNRYNEAIIKYKKVLNLAKTYNGQPMSVDTLLQIHALHNLIYAKNCVVLEHEVENENLTDYEDECVHLEWKYLEPYYNRLKKTQENSDMIRKQVQNIEKEKKIKRNWWKIILNDINDKRLDEQLMNKINLDIGKFTNSHNNDYIHYALTVWVDEIFSCRKRIFKDFDWFNDFVNNVKPRNELTQDVQREMTSFVNSVYECHLKVFNNSRNLCKLCEAKINLLRYKRTMFVIEDSLNPSIQETLIKILLSFAKNRSISLDYVTYGENFLELIEALKKEYKEYLKFWVEIEYTVKAYDELSMCKMRIQAEDEDESSNNDGRVVKIHHYDIDNIYFYNERELKSAEHKFSAKLPRLKYICHLRDVHDEGANDVVCPICKLDIDSKYSLFECGHHFCMSCLTRMVSYLNDSQIRSIISCAVCRYKQKYEEVYWVTKRKIDELQIVGQFSSKIDEMIRIIITLKNNDANIKIIIFSHWSQILEVIKTALFKNTISYKMKATPKNIDDFKNAQKRITCFLLSLNEGSKGLNLTEATHVFLVEPILNPGEESQAINRVHRIGQTKPTVVHRFIVKDSIEKTIHDTIKNDVNNIRQRNQLDVNFIRGLFNINS